MSLTVKESWNMRKKIVHRPRTYEQALAIYTYSKEIAEASNSRAGGYHLALAQCKTRQYPLIDPYWSRTFVGMLPAETNASRLDHTMYTHNDQVPEGRIAFYYACGGYYSTGLSASLELVLWHPDGRCLIGPVVQDRGQWGRRYRAEAFADMSMWIDRGDNCIRIRRDSSGRIPSLWARRKVLRSTLSRDMQKYHPEIIDSQTPPGMCWLHCKDYSNVFLIDRYTPVVIPKNRSQRPYLLRGVADLGVDADGNNGSEPMPRLESWAERRATRLIRTKIRRKMSRLARTMRGNEELRAYFIRTYGEELQYRASNARDSDQRQRRAQQTAAAPQPTVEFLEAGERHDRQLFLD
jgi:hypothetical protein